MKFACIAAGVLMLAFGVLSGFAAASPVTPGATRAPATAAAKGAPLVLAQRRDARPYRGGAYRGRTLGRAYSVRRGGAYRGAYRPSYRSYGRPGYGGRAYYRPGYRGRDYYGPAYRGRTYYRPGAGRDRYYRRYDGRSYRYYGDRGRYYRRYDGRTSRRFYGDRRRYYRRDGRSVTRRIYRDRSRYQRAYRDYYRRYGDRARRYYGDRGRYYRRDGDRYDRRYRRGYWRGYGPAWKRVGHRFKDRRLTRIVRKRDFHRGRFHNIYWAYGPAYGWWFGYPLYRYNWAGYDCHLVRMYDYWGGRYALIGGTLCYDELGYPYLYRRWLIRYVD